MQCAPCKPRGLRHCLGAWGQVGNEPHGFGKAAAPAPAHSSWCLRICCHPVLMLFVDGACFHLRKLLGTSLHQQDSLCFGGSFLFAVLSTGRDLSNGDTGFPCGPLLSRSQHGCQALCLVSHTLSLSFICYSHCLLKTFVGYTLDLIIQLFDGTPFSHF